MANILITGADGQLATAIKDNLKNDSASNYIFLNKNQLDITNYDLLSSYLKNHNIDYIINTAAYTNVDLAENEKSQADLVNSHGPENLAKLANIYNIKLIHISTDYVYSDYHNRIKNTPFTELDTPNPINYYGLSKLNGENNVINNTKNYIIIRTSWLYYYIGNNFYNTILRLANTKSKLDVVSDQMGTPTYCGDLADFILNIIELDIKNPTNNHFTHIYNFSNLGECSWYDFAKNIVDANNIKCLINPITSEQYPTIAKRPNYSVLDKTKILQKINYIIPEWKDGLNKCNLIKNNSYAIQ